jgi:hypothetical protein
VQRTTLYWDIPSVWLRFKNYVNWNWFWN